LQVLSNYLFLFPAIKENIISQKKMMLKELTCVVINDIENNDSIYKGSLTQSEIKKMSLEHIRNLNYGNDQKSYFWITDLTPKMIMHPYRQDLEGKILTDYRDIHGTALFDTAVDLVKKHGEGYMEYYWQFQDDSTKNIPKLSYVKLYKKWGWIVGTGIYIDDIEIELSKIRRNELASTLLISILMLALIISIILYGIKSEKQRKKTQHRLQLSEEKFRNIFQKSNDIILISNLDGIILDINKKALTTYDLTYQEVVGKTFFELIPEKYHEKVFERLRVMGNEELEPIEMELNNNKNKLFTVEIKSSLITYEDKKVILSTLRDITQRKMQEKNLIESRLHYKIVADYASNWEYWLGTDGSFKYISPSCKRITGYEADEFKDNPKLYTDIIVPEDQEKWEDHHTNALEHHVGNEVIQFRMISKMGNIVWIEHSCQPIYDNNHNYIGVRGSNRDISIRKIAEELLINANKELIVSEAKFKNLSNLTFEGIAIHEDGIVIDTNLSLLKMFGYTRDELVDKYILDLLFDKESQRILKSNIRKDYIAPYEVVGVAKDGRRFPVEVEGENFHTESNGKSLRVTAFRDISTRKKAENEIRKLSKAVEQSANMVIITDTKGIIEYANEIFYKSTGYTKEEVIGNSPRILKSGKQDKNFYKELWKTIIAGNVWRGEICNKKKNGDLFWESTLITPVFNQNNEITNFMSVKEDITDKKLADIKLFNAIIETEEKERKKFAEDLHDELGPHLSGIRLYINELEDEKIKPERRIDIVRMLDVLIKEAIDKTRTISNQLMPSILTDYGLIKALNSFCSRINNTKTIHVNLTYNDPELAFDKTTEIVVYRVIIELINNTIKHAKARNIHIDFNKNDEIVELVYKDDGLGFNLNEAIKQKKGLGINNIINRIKTLEGSFQFESYPEKGIIFSFTFLPKSNFSNESKI